MLDSVYRRLHEYGSSMTRLSTKPWLYIRNFFRETLVSRIIIQLLAYAHVISGALSKQANRWAPATR